MAGTTEFNLDVAWRALASHPANADWVMIPIMQPGLFSANAARRFPGDLEALVIDFPGIRVSETRRLPDGGGFEVVRPSANDAASSTSAIALVRHPAGELQMFKMMSTDILEFLDRNRDKSAPVLLNSFLDRVVSWQLFMQPSRGGPLSFEEQIGLFGELCVLGQFLDRNMSGQLAVEAWDGPMHGAQDYRINGCAVEVKSSAASEGFVAKIQSLEQLDDGEAINLFLVALRLEMNPVGSTLPELVEILRERLGPNVERAMFNRKLLAVGYNDDHSEAYDKRLRVANMLIHKVDANFPRLFRGNINHAIRRASYEIDIDGIEVSLFEEDNFFRAIGLE